MGELESGRIMSSTSWLTSPCIAQLVGTMVDIYLFGILTVQVRESIYFSA